MIIYKLIRFAWDFHEDLVFENENEEVVHQKALKLSAQGSVDGFSQYSYRLEKWADGERQRGFRFYNGGIELTQRIREAVLSRNEEE